MSLYDIMGSVVSSGVSSADIKNALLAAIADGSVNLGNAVGATLAYTDLSNAWIANAQSAYTSMLEKYKTLANGAIPFFISTAEQEIGRRNILWKSIVMESARDRSPSLDL